jgi:hypothetical protein
MSAWVSAAPVIGTGSLDGFATGALMSVTCAMAIAAPRRARRPSAARGGAKAAERGGWLCEHVRAAEPAGFGLATEAAVAIEAQRGPIPGRAPGHGVSVGGVSEQSAFPGSAAPRTAFPDSAAPRTAFPGSAAPRTAFPDSMFPRIGFSDGRPWRDARSGIVFPDVELAPPLIASARRPNARRPPRHAAPSVGLRIRMTGIGRRMTGLFATRALASGARG